MNQQSPQSKSPQWAGLSSGRRGSHLSDGAGLEGDGHGHRVAVYGEDGPRSGGWLGKLCITVHNCANKYMDILEIMIDDLIRFSLICSLDSFFFCIPIHQAVLSWILHVNSGGILDTYMYTCTLMGMGWNLWFTRFWEEEHPIYPS